MNTELKSQIQQAVAEYLAATEAWDDAQLLIDAASSQARLIEDEETDELPMEFDTYPIMDFVRMDSAGDWQPDQDAIEEIASQY